MEFKYNPTATRIAPISNRISGGQTLSGRISLINLGKLIRSPIPPIKNKTCSVIWILSQIKSIEPKIKILIAKFHN